MIAKYDTRAVDARHLSLRAAQLLFAIGAVAGCARSDPSTPDATRQASASPAGSVIPDSSPHANPGAVPAPDHCAKTGAWTRCNLEDRLSHSGFVYTVRPDSVGHSFFTVRGLVYDMTRAELQIFLYADVTARERDTRDIDPQTVSPKGERVNWPAPPLMVTSNNLVAIILSQNPRLIERLQLALAAGLPPTE